jgi:SAM-dependent methyltransferase
MTSPEPDASAPIWDDLRAKNWLSRVDGLEAQMVPISDALFDRARLQPGDRVLDVGCGSGATTRQAREAVRPGGRVTGLDISNAMIRAARARVGEDGIDWVVADAESQPFAPGAFDAVISRFGVMFFGDPVAAFTNLARACRSGGQLTMAVWCAREETALFNIPYQVVASTLDRLGATYTPTPPDVGPFSLGDKASVRSLLESAGWRDVDVRVDNRILHLGGSSSISGAIESVVDLGPASVLVQGQPPEIMAAVRTALAEEFERRHDGAGVALPGGFLVVSAARP